MMVTRRKASRLRVRTTCPSTQGKAKRPQRAAPMIINSCHYGIDTPNRSKLIAHNMELEEIREYIDVDSLAYLSIEDLIEASDIHPDHFCLACFNSQYPTPTPDQFEPRKFNPRHVDHSTEVYGL